jgi:hypothetical protein
MSFLLLVILQPLLLILLCTYSELYISHCNFLGIPVSYRFCQCIELSSYLTFFYKNFMQRFSPIPTFVHVDSHVIGD